MRRMVMLALTLAAVGVLSAPDAARAQPSAEERSELEAARERLAEAAREVARLSAEHVGPVVGDVMEQFRMPGRRAMLGISIEDAQDGVRVVGVSPGGPAEESGIETGDVILRMDGAELVSGNGRSPSEVLVAQMANVSPGDTVTLSVRGNGGERDVPVEARPLRAYAFMPRGGRGPVFDGRDFTMPAIPLFQGGRWRGMELVELTPTLGAYFETEEGILLVRAPEDERLSLRDGDVILEISGRVPMSTEHAMRILNSFEPGETLRLSIVREGRRREIEIELPPSARRG